MEQNKQTEDAKTATMICAFVISGQTRDSQILSVPICFVDL